MSRLASTICMGCAIVFFEYTSCIAAAEATLEAGVAVADITPEPGLLMWGYGSRTQPASGTLDPLMARALVLGCGDETVALVTLDLGRTPEDPLLDALRERLTKSIGISHVFITASHTHQAPSLESYDDEPNAFGVTVTGAIERIIAEAASNRSPVSVRLGTIEADFAHNRRRVLPDGRIAMQWRNAEREPTSPVDRECTVIRLDDPSGKPKAVLFHYACHPVVLGGDHLQYSADYVGTTCRDVEAALGTTCMFLQGACGDINPYVDKTPVAEGGVEAMQAMGHALGKLVVQAAETATGPSKGAASMRFERQQVPMPVRWDVSDPDVYAMLSRVYSRRLNLLMRSLKDGMLDLPLTMLVVNDEFALVGMPGEIFVDFQLDLKRRSPYPHALLVGYTNGYHAYFPTIRDAAAGGYGGKTATYVAVGTGEQLTDRAVIALYKMHDQLHDMPRPEDYRLIEWDDIKDQLGR